MFNNSTPSLSDIAAVTNNNDGFGGGNGWWILIILFAIFGGFGRGNYGYGGGDGSVNPNYVLATDFATIERKLDGVNNGLCDGFYAQNTNLLNGFANVRSDIAQAQFASQTATNALASQLQQCCCDNRAQIADVKYAMSTDTNAITTAINMAAQNIMQNDNANYRQLHDENVAAQLAAKDELIAELRAQNTRCDTANMIADQTAMLRAYIQPTPQPAYVVQNPYCNCGTNTGCGCAVNSCC